MAQKKSKIIWVDLDNTPHVLFFRPVIPELEKHGYKILVTARDAYQVSEVADLFKINCIKIGKHYGKNKLMKLLGTFIRALQMIPLVLKNRPRLAVSHGSRSQHVVANLLFIKSLDIYDYEHSATFFFTRTTWALAPDVVVRESACNRARKKTYSYPGIKENVYVPFFRPDLDIRKELGIVQERTVVLIRPPATEAHYHNPEAELILDRLLPFIDNCNAVGVLVPRNHRQHEEIENKFTGIIKKGNLIIPKKVYDGLTMIWYSDLVVSGGGTMNREAAALGVPVYSIFRGKLGAIDRHLSETGKLVLIQKPDDVETQIRIVRRETIMLEQLESDYTTFNNVIRTIEELCS